MKKHFTAQNLNFGEKMLKHSFGSKNLYIQYKTQQVWYHLIDKSISFNSTPCVCCLAGLYECYAPRTILSRNGGHFGRNLGF